MKKFAAIAAIMMMTTAPVFAAQGGFSGPSATQNQTQTQQGGFVDGCISKGAGRPALGKLLVNAVIGFTAASGHGGFLR